MDGVVNSPYRAFDHLATLVAVVRPDGRCVFANAAFGHVLGWSSRSRLREMSFKVLEITW